MSNMLAADFYSDDRRRVLNIGIRHGRDAAINNMQASAGLEIAFAASRPIAIRGGRLVLSRSRWSGPDQRPEAFHTEVLSILELGVDDRITAHVMFDSNDIDAAFAELDARYLAGEAAEYARTWSVTAGSYAAQAKREFPAMTPDCVTIDHRRTKAFAPGDMAAYIRAGWDLDQTIRTYVEVVHRLSDLGAVCTYVGHGVSRDGFDAEWREVALTTVQGDMANRCELYDEEDLDASLAIFEELQPHTPLLENPAGRIFERYQACFSARDWAAMAQLLADDITVDDRRRVVNAGIRRGRGLHIADNQAAVEVGAETISSSVIATRGERLVLAHLRTFNRGMSGGVGAEMIVVTEIDADELIVAGVIFDIDDIASAYEELDARYLAGEAAPHAHAWSVIATVNAAFN